MNSTPPQQPPTNKALLITLIGVVIIAALIIWGLNSSKQPIPEPEDSGSTAAAQWPSREMKRETLTDNTKAYEISAEYPVTSRADITDKLRGFVEDSINTFKLDTAGYAEGSLVTLDISYTEEQSTLADNYIFHIFADTGGAHGIEATKTFSFDGAGNLITLEELFTNETRGLQLVSEHVKQVLMKREFADSAWISEGASPTEENYQNFVITDTGLTFIFDSYQVAAYAAGAQNVEVPVSVFKTYANTKIFK
jgi:hypothetical protein